MAFSPTSSQDSRYGNLTEEEETYMLEMDRIYAQVNKGPCKMPAKLRSYLFIGGYGDANNFAGLKKRGITHVLNCASVSDHRVNPYPPESGVVGFAQFHGEDRDGYDILQHLPMAQTFVKDCRNYGGRLLIHCAVGVNRSATLCIAYLMEEEGIDLLTTVGLMKERRGTIPTNRHFRLQLIRFAKERGLLKDA